MLHFADLTPEQRARICNGCGPKGNFVPVPDFLFTASCDHHDFRYWRGGIELDRLAADNEFLYAMLADAGECHEMQVAAYTYYLAVRVFGAVCFHYAATPRDENDLALLFT